jgi:excisionase family DNA binding protein
MVQEYLNLEAAQQLGMSKEDLAKKAQKREIRAFADRGTWKFRKQDIEEHARQAGIGSGAEIVFGDMDEGLPELDSGSSDQILLSDQTLAETPSGSGKRVIGMDEFGRTPSDSDVRLVPESTAKKGSDSDVKLVGGTKPPSDSDVKVVAAGTAEGPDSDVKIKGPAPGDSDVRLDRAKAPSDSGIRMADTVAPAGHSDVTQDLPVFKGLEDEGLAISSGSSGDQPIAGDPDSDFDLSPPKEDSSFELGTQGDSDITLALDDNVGLVPDEIKLAPKAPSDSDVTVGSPSSSGLSLSSPADSGIALDRAPSPGRSSRNLGATEGPPTKPASDIFETDFEVPVLDSDQEIPSSGSSDTEQLSADSDFELSGSDVGGAEADSSSQVLSLEGEEQVDEAAATRLQAAPQEDEQWEEDLAGDVDDSGRAPAFEEDSGAVEVGERSMAEDSGSAPALAPVGVGEAEWSGLTVGALGFATFLMLILGMVMLDMVRTMWGWEDQMLFYRSPILSWMSSLLP